MKRILLSLSMIACCTAALAQAADGVAEVPEPGSIILLGTAAAGIGYATWRRNRKK